MTGQVLSWLPDRHLGVVATLAHADDLITKVSDLLLKYQREPDVIGVHEVVDGRDSVATVSRVAPLPRQLPLLVADALVTLRSAVEHTLFAEVEYANGEPLEERVAKTIEMPARLTYEAFASWVADRDKKGPSALARPSQLLQRVESLQPFHRVGKPGLHPLARLVSHTNHAKHRMPAVTAVRLIAVVNEDDHPRSVRELDARPEAPVQVGEVITRTPLGKRVEVSLFPSIGVRRPGTDEWPILMHELDELSQWVRRHAIPRLITGDDQYGEPLPAYFDIATGHKDERAAIAVGTVEPAALRSKERFGASIARESLVELLIDGSEFSREELSRWTVQLSDRAVLERVEALKPTIVGRSADVSENLRVLAELEAEARRFIEAGSASEAQCRMRDHTARGADPSDRFTGSQGPR